MILQASVSNDAVFYLITTSALICSKLRKVVKAKTIFQVKHSQCFSYYSNLWQNCMSSIWNSQVYLSLAHRKEVGAFCGTTKFPIPDNNFLFETIQRYKNYPEIKLEMNCSVGNISASLGFHQLGSHSGQRLRFRWHRFGLGVSRNQTKED